MPLVQYASAIRETFPDLASSGISNEEHDQHLMASKASPDLSGDAVDAMRTWTAANWTLTSNNGICGLPTGEAHTRV